MVIDFTFVANAMQTDFGNIWHLFIIMKYNAQNVLSDTVTDYIYYVTNILVYFKLYSEVTFIKHIVISCHVRVPGYLSSPCPYSKYLPSCEFL